MIWFYQLSLTYNGNNIQWQWIMFDTWPLSILHKCHKCELYTAWDVIADLTWCVLCYQMPSLVQQAITYCHRMSCPCLPMLVTLLSNTLCMSTKSLHFVRTPGVPKTPAEWNMLHKQRSLFAQPGGMVQEGSSCWNQFHTISVWAKPVYTIKSS